jgi:hypothetical protein
MPSDNIEFYGDTRLTVVTFPAKLAEEMREMVEELDKGWDNHFEAETLEAVALEVLDVMQVCYSFLNTYFDEEEIEALNILHLLKLRSRHG